MAPAEVGRYKILPSGTFSGANKSSTKKLVIEPLDYWGQDEVPDVSTVNLESGSIYWSDRFVIRSSSTMSQLRRLGTMGGESSAESDAVVNC